MSGGGVFSRYEFLVFAKHHHFVRLTLPGGAKIQYKILKIKLSPTEEGVECVTAHKEEILACINNYVPDVLNTYNNPVYGMVNAIQIVDNKKSNIYKYCVKI